MKNKLTSPTAGLLQSGSGLCVRIVDRGTEDDRCQEVRIVDFSKFDWFWIS